MEKLTRRQRQRKKKKDANTIAKAEETMKRKADRDFDLYNAFGIKDPTPKQAWHSLLNKKEILHHN